MTEQEENKKNITLEKAKQEVYKIIQGGLNYRDIAQTEFLINNKVKKFSISEIAKIKKEFEPELNLHQKDSEKAHLFKLFKKGKTPVQAIIETQLDSVFVKNSYEEYLSLEHKTILDESLTDILIELSGKVLKVTKWKDLGYAMQKAVESHIELQKHIYLCAGCREPMPIREKALQDAQVHLSEKWYHVECWDEKQNRLTGPDVSQMFINAGKNRR